MERRKKKITERLVPELRRPVRSDFSKKPPWTMEDDLLCRKEEGQLYAGHGRRRKLVAPW
jgi:hypothetical protein